VILFKIGIISLEFGFIRLNLLKICKNSSEKKASYNCRELLFPGAANGAHPICGEIFKCGVGRNICRGVSVGRLINIAANSTLVVLHAGLL
jgi:hypothetical protein